MNDLKPCPFCGAYPRLYCDITDWKGKPVYKPNPNGYRPTMYVLKSSHKIGCFIRHMDGTNEDGRMTACNATVLIEKWNRRCV